MLTIKVLTDFKDGKDAFYKGETRRVTEAAARLYCTAGWAKDISGTIETGVPNTDPVTLEVHSLSSPQAAENING